MAGAELVPSEVGGYILAGGRSSRMGADKALLPLAGKPLLRHAVKKLRRVCMDVRILSSQAAHGVFAPLVPDLHPGCGPLAGIEAALSHSIFDWNLIFPVDLPFLPTAFVDSWVRGTIADERRGVRIALFTIDGIPQPALLLIHRDALSGVQEAVMRAEFKLFPVLEACGRELAEQLGFRFGRVFSNANWGEGGIFNASSGRGRGEAWQTLTPAQSAAQALWFANLNTPEEFAQAEANADVLDT
jgi:molybdenum cofactor guanylyltransferase